MRGPKRRWVRITILVILVAAAVAAMEVVPLWLATRAPSGEADRLADLVGLQAGTTVAEIGAGAGHMAVRMARRVGSAGLVYATELGHERVAALHAGVNAAGLSNIEVRPAAAAATGLPEACCSLIYMRLVYHHFTEPVTLLRDAARALGPGGRLVVIDFESRPGLLSLLSPAGRGGHGVTLDEVVAEAAQAGLDVERTIPGWTGRTFLVEFAATAGTAR